MLIAIVIGAGGACIAWFLLKMIGLVTNLFYYQRLSTEFASPAGNQLGVYAIAVPVVGSLIVGLMARYGSEQIRGHGIPEAIESILMNGSRIRPRLAILKPLSAAISIGSGGPFGAEGPIIMTGGAIGSIIAQFFHLTSMERRTLLVAGAAAGMSATFAAPLSADHEQVLKALHVPGGSAHSSSSAYFCLSDLAQHWPSRDTGARREVVMVTDGVDAYQPRFDPEDPYVQAAITDAVRAHLVVYSIYWMDRGFADQGSFASNAGQSLLLEVTQATGGRSFWEGMGNPVSFEPYFDELIRRFRNQYELGFSTVLRGKPEVESLKLKLSAPGAEVDAPQQVQVSPAEPVQR